MGIGGDDMCVELAVGVCLDLNSRIIDILAGRQYHGWVDFQGNGVGAIDNQDHAYGLYPA